MVALLRSDRSQTSIKSRCLGCSCVSVDNSNDSNDLSPGDPLLRCVDVSVPVCVRMCVRDSCNFFCIHVKLFMS